MVGAGEEFIWAAECPPLLRGPGLLALAQMCFRGRRGIGEEFDDVQRYLSIFTRSCYRPMSLLLLLLLLPSLSGSLRGHLKCHSIDMVRTKHTQTRKVGNRGEWRSWTCLNSLSSISGEFSGLQFTGVHIFRGRTLLNGISTFQRIFIRIEWYSDSHSLKWPLRRLEERGRGGVHNYKHKAEGSKINR